MTIDFHKKYDINCDLGEGETLQDCKLDRQLMPFISRCNIACGGHAGNTITMKETLTQAKKYQVLVGAHPSYPDKNNFGRKILNISFESLEKSLLEQIHHLKNLATEQNISLSHIKCHGALYNEVEKNQELAEKLSSSFQKNFPQLAIMGIANGCMQKSAKKYNINFIKEGFMDRAYQNNGLLVPRSENGAVFKQVEKITKQAENLLRGKKIHSIDNKPLEILIDSVCLHGDNPNAIEIAKKLFTNLYSSNDAVKR